MKQTGRYFIALGCVLCAAILVLDGDVVAAGALSGVQLCLQTVIPSLFCFMVLTGFLINSGLYHLISLPLGPLTKGLWAADCLSCRGGHDCPRVHHGTGILQLKGVRE